MHNTFKNSLFIILLALFSCGPQNRTASSRIDHAEAISDSLPQLALAMLDSLEEESRTYPETLRMRYELVRGEAQNRAYVDFTTDSVMKVVAEYYDRHGDPNTRAKAHYILGCAYRDMNEAPLAVNSYYDAIEATDTLSDDCDYSLLMRIWGQMADVYTRKDMPLHEREALKQTRKYAKLSNNTHNYINALQQMARVYLTLGKPDSIVYFIELAQKLYRQNGYYASAAAASPLAILVYIRRGEYGKARELMNLYENESGLFDSEGNIVASRKNYYYTQGMYYMGIGQVDSAKERFQKLVQLDSSQFDGYMGLLFVAKANNDTDSILYYAEKYVYGLDSLNRTSRANALANAEALYNYKRNARLAHIKTEEVHSYKLRLLMLFLFVIVAATAAFGISYVFRRRRRREIERLHNTLTTLKNEYTARVGDLQAMEENFIAFKECKKQELSLLNEKIKLQKSALEAKTATSAIFTIETLLKDKMMPTPGFQPSISEAEWQSIYSTLLQHRPDTYDTIVKHPQLSQQETHVAILTFLGFGTSDTATLLASTKYRISNAKASVNKKLFGDATSKTLYSNLSKLRERQE